MEISVAKTAGFCYGVKRAVDIAMEQCQKGEVYTLGAIIHNKSVVNKLREKNVKDVESVEEIPDKSTVIIRAHGVGAKIYEQLNVKGCNIVDATCPHVARIHDIAKQQSDDGRKVVIIGTHNHPESIGISGWCDEWVVIENLKELVNFFENYDENCDKPLSVVAQTTSSKEFFKESKEFIKKTCKMALFFDTICNATEIRQNEAADLSASSDLMVVIGDKMSSNSKHLSEICNKNCKTVLFVENANEIDSKLFSSCHHIGVTAGASTPEWIIKEVLGKMTENVKTNSESGESFAELFEQSFKTLHRGEKVRGTVSSIAGNEVYVDLGVKCIGVINVSEISSDRTYRLEDANLKVGDEIDAIVIKINDEAGVISLSQKIMESHEGWSKVEQAYNDKTILEGTVTEENKGGIVVVTKGVRVFIPASQTGLRRGEALAKLLKSNIKFVIKEIDETNNKVVGSMKELFQKERNQAASKIWETIAVGNEYTGVVKTITSYGIFVDIGGVDGMVHISELSWTRVKDPSEVVSLGQEIKVHVLSFDNDKKKISLGYRRVENNPWTLFQSQYSDGMIVNVEIKKIMAFGAFAEIIPGVDGLIHISQVGTKHIASVQDVLKVGQKVDAKIIEINHEEKRIALSIRAILEETSETVEQ